MKSTMGEATAVAVERVEDLGKTAQDGSLLDRIDDIFKNTERRAYEIFAGNGQTFGHDIDDWFQAERELLHPVHLNLSESDDGFTVKAEVPGFSEKELEIGVEPRRLTITGKRDSSKEQKKGTAVYTESCSDQLLRFVDLPAEIDSTKAAATLKNGVLELTLPKTAKAHTVRIQPKSA